MKLNDISIRNRLLISFGIILISLMLLGFYSYKQARLLQRETELMYSSPLRVRQAVASIEKNVVGLRLDTRDLLLSNSQREIDSLLSGVDRKEILIDQNFKILYNHYLGDIAHVNSALRAYELWNKQRARNADLAIQKETKTVKDIVSTTGKSGVLRADMYKKLDVISNEARDMANRLHEESINTAQTLLIWLIVILLSITILILLIGVFLSRKIRLPIEELKKVMIKFKNGDLNVRSNNESNDEIGMLAVTFNEMLEFIRNEREIANKRVRITDALLAEDNLYAFCHSLLNALATETNAQSGAVYINSNETDTLSLFVSLGLIEDNLNIHFDVNSLEGEFGKSINDKTIVFHKNISSDTRFVYKTVYGNIIPREIVTIPVISEHQVVAVISLSSINGFDTIQELLLQKMYNELCARVINVFAYAEIRKQSSLLKEKNELLVNQRNELNLQALELERQNAELEMQKEQLRDANKHKTAFLSNMSHELRTPLNSVISLSGVLNRRLINKIPPEEYSYLDIIERNGKHLLSLINSILEIARIESGKESIEITEFSPNVLIDEILQMLNGQIVERGNVIIKHYSGQELKLENDETKFRHIVQNLIANAVKFTENGTITISLTDTSDKFRFEIADTGIGIEQDKITKIFEEFTQADSGTAKKFEGTGLGLTIAKKYAQMLGGDIEVKSAVGVGTVFVVEIPLKVKAAFADNTFEENNSKSNSQTKSNRERSLLLIVDDSQAARIQLKDIIDEHKYEVLVASDGEEALRIMEENKPDAIVLDIVMPKMDGFQLLEKIRNFEPTKDVPVLVLTAKHISSAERAYLKHNHIFQLLQKGEVDKKSLLFYIEKMLN